MNAIIAFSLKRRRLIVSLLLLSFVVGMICFKRLNIEAYPDPVPPLVDIITQSDGQSAEEIERYITIPIEVQMAGIPNVTAIRTISLFGLSDVKLQFTYDFTYQQAEQWVINRLSQLPPLPNGAQPGISPWSPIGEIYRYRLVGPPNYSVTDLKTLQDWTLNRRFKSVPGVIDINGWGGKTKTYEIEVDQPRLSSYGVTLPQVIQALNNSNINVGGQTVDIGPQAAVVRGVGLIRSMEDVRGTMISSVKGIPVTIGDVAQVKVGNRPRLGIAGMNQDDDIVEGIVLMRRGAQSMPTLELLRAEIDKVNSDGTLPPGVKMERIYDRTDLIKLTTNTVLHNMVLGIVLIFFVQWLFLGNLRSAIIVAATIPFALFFAITILYMRGESGNLLSVGAIDFGLIVDSTVIMVENIFRHLSEPRSMRYSVDTELHRVRTRTDLRGKLAEIANSASEVNRAIFFSAAIIIAGFIPLFTLSGVEGHIFGPMANTYAYAIAGGLLATFTVSPALAAILLPAQTSEIETVAVRYLRRAYTPLVKLALENPRRTLMAGAGVLLLAIFCGMNLGSEFLPKLEEGNLWIRATMPGSISLKEGNQYVNRIRNRIREYPEVVSAISQNGRPDDGTDSTGFFNAEFYVPLKPASEWPRGVTKNTLTDDISKKLQDEFPGIEFNFSQNIEDNVAEAMSGVKGANSIKLFGNDLETLEKTAHQIKKVMETVPGITDLAVFSSLGQPAVKIEVDRARAARYGLAPGDINATVQAAIGGQAVGDIYEESSDRHFPMVVRLAPEYRKSFDTIARMTIGAPRPDGNGVTQIPLADVANIHLISGAAFIYREGQARYIPIRFSVRGRDLGGAVQEAQKKIAEQVKLPGGYRLEWNGEFGELKDALSRLSIIVPISLLLIMALLYLNFGSLVDTGLAMSVMPMALLGGVFSLFITGTPFSVSAAIGFIALFGIAAMEGIILLSAFNRLLGDGLVAMQAMLTACEIRMRPMVMTCLASFLGLFPAAISTGIGSQVQRPLALVVMGGILLAPVLILVIMPVIIMMFSEKAKASMTASALEAETPQS